jgi:hypothetical protein
MSHARKPDLEEALREALKPGPAPEALRARLMAQAGQRARTWTPLRAALLAVAAVLVVSLGALAIPRKDTLGHRRALEQAVSEAAAGYAHVGALSFQEDACAGKGCGDWAQTPAGFRAPLPQSISETQLHGGGACRIGGQSAVHYLLRDGRMIYVFAHELEACRGGRPACLDRGTYEVRAWNEQGRGYLLLARK